MGNDLVYLAGGKIAETRPLPPYSDIVCRFLDTFSTALLKDPDCRRYPDMVAVAFWARKGNIARLKAGMVDGMLRLGKGLAFHITPSNIPVQFMFSYMFGLLAGNANVVRVTTKEYPQIPLLCRVLERILAREEFHGIRSMTSIVRYARASDWTREFSLRCQVRLVWGGDATIAKVRACPLPPRTTELTFGDRYSMALLHAGAIAEAEDKEIQRLARDFYNDTFLMDQNACSSPQLILWKEEKGAASGKKRFWQAVEQLARSRYDLLPAKATSKYADFCKNAVLFPQTGALQARDNYLYRIPLSSLPKNAEDLRGQFGLFYEYDLKDFSELDALVNEKYQTLTYYGFDPEALAQSVLEKRWLGIDRIVPIGKALDMDVFWDGHDLIREMSRIVDVRCI